MHAILSAVEGAIKDLVESDLDGSISRYAEPVAEGIRPVFRTVTRKKDCKSEALEIVVDVYMELTYFSQLIRSSCALRSLYSGACCRPQQGRKDWRPCAAGRPIDSSSVSHPT